MKKTFALIAKKAMVYTMTAAMLVSTPLTASAAEADYSDAFEDFELTVDPDNPDPALADVSGTDTITASSGLDLGGDYAEKLTLSIAFKDTAKTGLVYPEKDVEVVATVTGADDALKEKIGQMLTWHIYQPGTTTAFGGGSATTPSVGKPFGIKVNMKADGKADRWTAILTTKMGGDADLVCALDDWKNNVHLAARLPIHVTEYSSSLGFKSGVLTEVYPKYQYNLGLKRLRTDGVDGYEYKYLDRGGFNPNEDLTWDCDAPKKIAEIDANGKLKIKKKFNGEITIKVKGGSKENPVEASVKVKCGKANPAKKITFDNKKPVINAVTGKEATATVKATMTAKNKNAACTDVLEWSSNKPGIVTVEYDEFGADKGATAKLVAHSAGKAKITAKASGGKKASITVTVNADLKGLKIVEDQNVYYGQNKTLKLDRDHAWNTSKMKYTVVGTKADKKLVKISSKGVIKIKNDVTADTKIKVVVSSKNKKDTLYKTDKEGYITVKPAKCDKVNVLEMSGKAVAGPYTLEIGKNLEFRAYTNPRNVLDSLSIKSAKAKNVSATIDETGKITITALKKIKKPVKITVTGYNGKSAKTVTFDISVK